MVKILQGGAQTQGLQSVFRLSDPRVSLPEYLEQQAVRGPGWTETSVALCNPEELGFGWLRNNFAEKLTLLQALQAMVKDYREKAQVWGKFGPASSITKHQCRPFVIVECRKWSRSIMTG